MTARAVSNRVRCISIDWVPRAVVAMRAPIDDKAIATIERATKASISVNPALFSGGIDWNNLDPSRQPVDPHFIASARSAQCDDTAARHSGRKETDCVTGRVMPATGW